MKSDQRILRFTFFSGLTIVILILFEIVLRAFGAFDNYGEILDAGYQSYYGDTYNTHHWLQIPNNTIDYNRQEFNYQLSTNSLGFREREIPSEKSDSVLRIFTFGDSYCEGMGAPYDSTWPRLLEDLLLQDNAVELFNCGVTGSDPWFSYSLLDKLITEFQPDLVISAINISDYSDFMVRGGIERFLDDGTTKFKSGPKWEGLYRASRLFRVIMHGLLRYDRTLIRPDMQKKLMRQFEDELVSCTRSMDSLLREHGADLMCLIHPTGWEIVDWEEPRTWMLGTQSMFEVSELLTKAGIDNINLYPAMNEAIGAEREHEFSWQIDRHYNSKGYQLMADRTYHELISGYVELLQKPMKIDAASGTGSME